MSHSVLIFISLLILINVSVVLWLIQAYRKLSKQHEILSDCVERNNKDIAGLCSAALSIDTKLINNNEQLKDVADQVADFKQNEEQASQPYHSAIQRVRQGANAEELIQQCGLSREEAILLIRLHGNS